jgi:Sulfotransferase family
VSTGAKRGALPTFFIIGAPKTGTTSLYHYLEVHPEIQMSTVKEPSFFAPALDSRDIKRGVSRLDKYEQLFDPAVAVRGEASTNYAEYPLREGVPDRIERLVPDAKFIYLVRDPIDRTVSHYRHIVANGSERRSLWEACSDLSDPRSPWISASLYALQLELYLRRFPQERILVVDQAELLTERRAVLRKIFAFLEVDEDFDSRQFDDELLKGSEHRTYPLGLARFIEHTVRPRTSWIAPGARRMLRRHVERALPRLDTEPLNSEMRIRLEEFYSSETGRLRTLTGHAFPTWSV